MWITLCQAFFALFFDTRCKALMALDTELAKLAFENEALPLCSYWRFLGRYLIRTVGLRTGHRWGKQKDISKRNGLNGNPRTSGGK